jgi:hypothetical protein
VSSRDRVFEPLHGKGITLRQALELLVGRWNEAPLGDEDTAALESALQHLFRRARLRRQLPATAEPALLAREFLRALQAGQGAQALAALG